jgi:hypothetical protein
MNKRALIIAVGLIVVLVVWYLFRPELTFISTTVNEKFSGVGTSQTNMSSVSPVELYTGSFHSVAHETKGVATTYRLLDGKRVLRFTDFETSNGPDVQVHLVAANDANDNETVTKAGFVHLGGLKGNIGDQNYDLPRDIDLTKYRSVTIWCRRFGVNFATAPLTPVSDAS